MIETHSVDVSINGRDMLQDVSVTFHRGQLAMILGPNGAGKSTLLRCLSGALKTTAGVIDFDNRRLSDYRLEELAQRRAVLSQSTPISFPFTAKEVVLMGRNPHATKRTTIKDTHIVEAALAAMDADNLAQRIFPTLSGGEQQRVHLARVLAQISEQEQACLLLDEPTSALDLKHQHRALNFIKQMAREQGHAVVMVMHDIHLAKRYADYAVLLKNGRVQIADVACEALTATTISDVFDVSAELVLL